MGLQKPLKWRALTVLSLANVEFTEITYLTNPVTVKLLSNLSMLEWLLNRGTQVRVSPRMLPQARFQAVSTLRETGTVLQNLRKDSMHFNTENINDIQSSAGA